jgi:hypothetical protein
MILPDVNDVYADFILNYAKKDGLSSLVRELTIDEERDKLKVDLQPDLIDSFSVKFPDVDLSHLDDTVEWILMMSIKKTKDGVK